MTTATKALDAKLLRAGDFHEVDFDQHGELHDETVYPVCTATWRGDEIEVRVRASRYRSSSGVTSWNLYVDKCNPGVTETARAALSEACIPLAEAWLETADYVESRQKAYYFAIRNVLREQRHSTRDPRRLMEKHARELSGVDRARLETAIEALDAFLLAVDA